MAYGIPILVRSRPPDDSAGLQTDYMLLDSTCRLLNRTSTDSDCGGSLLELLVLRRNRKGSGATGAVQIPSPHQC